MFALCAKHFAMGKRLIIFKSNTNLLNYFCGDSNLTFFNLSVNFLQNHLAKFIYSHNVRISHIVSQFYIFFRLVLQQRIADFS